MNLLHEIGWHEDGHIEGGSMAATLVMAGLVMPQQRP
jgi:hypothetical protein